MSALPLRRVLLLSMPLALVLGACKGKSIAGPDLGAANPAVIAQAVVTSDRCTKQQLDELSANPPCGIAGSECTPEYGTVVPWAGYNQTLAPVFTWTFPCNPDFYLLKLSILPTDSAPGTLAQWTLSNYSPDGAGPALSWSPTVPLPDPHARYVYTFSAVVNGVGGTWPSAVVFWTGPYCQSGVIPYAYRPDLLSPSVGAEVALPEESTVGAPGPQWHPGSGFRWSEVGPGQCVFKYEGQVSTDPTFTTGVMPILTHSPWDTSEGAVGGAVEWCHVYHWRVRAYNDTNQGPWSAVRSFKITPPGGADECNTPSAPIRAIEAVATKNVACRIGPGTFYAIAAYVAAGERHPVEGRNAAGTWVKVKLQDLKCYINRELVTLEQQGTPFPGGADVSGLISVLPDPPLPTETPKQEAPSGPSGPACSRSLSQGECTAGGWTWTATGGCLCP